MKFIEQNRQGSNQFVKYLTGSLLLILLSFVGQLPILLAAAILSFQGSLSLDASMEVLFTSYPLVMLVIALMPFVFSFFGAFLIIKFLHKQPIVSVFTARKQLDFKRIFFAFVTYGVLLILMAVINLYLTPEVYQWNFKPLSFFWLCVIALTLLPIQTSCEELVFRGYLMQGLGTLYPARWFPLLLTSLIFGLLHMLNPEVEQMGRGLLFYYISMGLFLGIVTLLDEGTELALGMHAANNVIQSVLITSPHSVLQTPAIFIDQSTPDLVTNVLLPQAFAIVLFLFIFSKKYKWADWRKKLIGIADSYESTIPPQNSGKPNL